MAEKINDGDGVGDIEIENTLDLDIESLDSFDCFNDSDIHQSPHPMPDYLDISDIDISDGGSSLDSEPETKSNTETEPGSDNEDAAMVNPEWTKEYSDFDVREFRGRTGPLLPPDFLNTSEARLVDYFQLYFTQELTDLIVKCTNDYSQRYQTNKRIVEPDY